MGCTVGELLERIGSSELTDWYALLRVEQDEANERRAQQEAEWQAKYGGR